MSGGDERMPFADYVLQKVKKDWKFGEVFFMEGCCYFSNDLKSDSGWKGASKDSWTLYINLFSVTLYRYVPNLEHAVEVKLTRKQAKAFRFLEKERKAMIKANKAREKAEFKLAEEQAKWWP